MKKEEITAKPLSIKELFHKEFLIPNFQRSYSWDEEQCVKLWEDFINFFEDKEGDDGYYLGSLFIFKYKKDKNIVNVIDGQQRLITLSILIKALCKYANTHTTKLEECLFEKNSTTDKEKLRVNIEDVRGKDKVRGKDEALFKTVISGEGGVEEKDNRFLKNYKIFDEKLSEWKNEQDAKNHDAKSVDELIEALLDKVILLSIECANFADALTIFETINDRGKPLGDDDIFKIELYESAQEVGKEKEFDKRWNELESHGKSNPAWFESRIWLFRAQMYTLRAQYKIEGREIGLREFYKFGSKSKPQNSVDSVCKEWKPFKEWESFIKSLEKHHRFIDSWCNEASTPKIRQWNHVISWHRHQRWCRLPLHVFFHKYADDEKGSYDLPDEKKKELADLMELSIKYFCIKRLVDNSTNNAMKNDVYEVCKCIHHEEDYISIYKSIYKKEVSENKTYISAFKEKINENSQRNNDGSLVLLGAYLGSDKKDKTESLYEIEQDLEVEHILPWYCGQYPEWEDKSPGEDINKFGNLLLLERKINRSVGNKSFKEKQKAYENSCIQDAQDLAKKAKWDPETLEERNKEILRRFEKFFQCEIIE